MPFFAAGALAVAARSDLEIPPPLPRLFSPDLLLAIVLRGGTELRHAGLSGDALRTLGAGLGMSVVVPLVDFSVLRRRVSTPDAGNGYVLTACEPGELARVAEAVRPILRTFGAVCLVSDAEWLLH